MLFLFRRNMLARDKNWSAFRQAAAVACLAAYLIGGVGLLPKIFAFGAWFEGTHQVFLGSLQDQMIVVLSHQRLPAVCFGQQAANDLHRHGLASRLVCLFATQSGAQGDHAASFAATSICERPSVAAQGKTKKAFAISLVVTTNPALLRTTALTEMNRRLCSTACPSPAFHLVGSTVLLI
jgi:hypothetical protein